MRERRSVVSAGVIEMVYWTLVIPSAARSLFFAEHIGKADFSRKNPALEMTKAKHSVRCCRRRTLRRQGAIAFRAAVSEELPHLANLGNHVQIKISHHNFILVAAGLRNDLPPRIAEVTFAVEFAMASRFPRG